MNIGIIGMGAIGRFVAEHLASQRLGPNVVITRSKPDFLSAFPDTVCMTDAVDIPQQTSLMIDCAGHAALAQHGCAILERGIDLITVSLGALADENLAADLADAASRGGSQLLLASGATGALDAMQAAKTGGLDEVTYIGRKPPKGWKGSPAEEKLDLETLAAETTHFKGTAREAALAYPKNANVAAAVALAGAGFEDTHVKLIADPGITANVHEVYARGAFGTFSFHIEGHALPDNPRSSALAAMSVIASINRARNPITF